MFDPVGAFKKQFTEVEGGYLVYPSPRSGGKLVTAEEYALLLASWERVTGRAGQWKTVGIVIVAIVLWTLLLEIISLPDWTDTLLIAVTVVAVSARLYWHSSGPRRLVKDRAFVAPPRSMSEARQNARAALNWPFVLFVLLFSGAAFWRAVATSDRTLSTWAWLIGSGLFLGLYLWIGVQKLLDRRR